MAARIIACIGHIQQNFGSRELQVMTCMGGGQGLPCAEHGWFQLTLQWTTLTHHAPKQEPVRIAPGTSAKMHLRSGGRHCRHKGRHVRRYRSRWHVRTHKKRHEGCHGRRGMRMHVRHAKGGAGGGMHLRGIQATGDPH